jgi:hypothetical protein
MLLMESPVYTYPSIKENFFNLTMTYKIDSDIQFPYGTYHKYGSEAKNFKQNKAMKLFF